MEKRVILAFVLSIAILFGYQYFFDRGTEPPVRPPAPGDSAQVAGKDNAAGAPPAGAAPAVAAPEPLGPRLSARAKNPHRWIAVNTPLYTATIATAGGGIQSFRLARYRDRPGPDGKPLDIVGSGSIRPLPLDPFLAESEPAFPALPVFASAAPDAVEVGEGEKASVTLSWESEQGVRILREYRFTGGEYLFELEQKVSNGPSGYLRLRSGIELSQRFAGELRGDSYTFHGAVVASGKGTEQYDLGDIEKGKVPKAPVRWVSADAKYFALVAIPAKEWPLEGASLAGEEAIRISMADAPIVLGPKEVSAFSTKVFMGPKEYSLLRDTAKDLEELVDYGWFAFLAKPLVWLLSASNRVTGNYGIDIILLTILIKILFYPLTHKSMLSMRKMQDLAPEINRIKEKFKNDKARMNQEVMNLYKTYNINPLSGCLPLLLQIPVFIALYKGLLVAIELRHSPFLLWINDLSAPEHLWDISVAGYTIPIRLLPLLMGVSMFVQQKMTPSAGMDPSQQKIMLFLPVIFTFMFWGFPTGLTIYWLMNNLLSIGQQVIQNRQIAAEQAAKA